MSVHTTDEHVIGFSWTTEERREAMAAFVRDGLRCRAAICALTCSQDMLEVLDELRKEGEDIDGKIGTGQITVLSVREILVECSGMMDVPKVLAWVRRQHGEAISRGFSAFWMTMEMTWALEHPGDEEKLARLEAALNDLAVSRRATIVSRYDLDRVDNGRLVTILRAAKRVEIGEEIVDNPYFTPPDELFDVRSERALFNQMLDNIDDRRERNTLLDSEDLLRALFREIDVGFVLFEVLDKGEEGIFDFVAVQANPVMEEINNLAEGGVIGKHAADLFPTHDVEIIEILSEVAFTGASARFERFKADTRQHFEVIAFRPKLELCAALVTDITERKRLEELRQRSEFRIRQTQKMEAIGRLASGVAHDFNNILTAIAALSNVLLEEIPREWQQWSDVDEIRKASERAASLTRQLLAFSRKQEIAPKVLNLNQVIEDSQRLLSRIIGEDIHFIFLPDEVLKPVRFDPNQIEQILANFATNARDAMPQGGELVIETRNVEVTEHQISPHGEVRPGSYVRLKVTDTGVGMPQAVQERIFEPFFTTKEKSKGTGLGLATVYGIVRQNNGAIFVQSAPGKGTSFEIYLPSRTSVIPTAVSMTPASLEPGTGTILLVEDEETVRNLTKRILERSGYDIISAASAEEAQILFKNEGFRVDLLITDVVMPGMDGVVLASNLRDQKPGLRVLYVSGYPEDVLKEHGISPSEVSLLEKPFSPEVLTARLKQLLQGESSELTHRSRQGPT